MKPTTFQFNKSLVRWLLENYDTGKGSNPNPEKDSGRVAIAHPIDDQKIQAEILKHFLRYSKKNGIQFHSVDDIAVVEYTKGGVCKYHSDISVFDTKETHKISIVVQLSDPTEYSGGRLIIYDNGTPYAVDRKLGQAIMFPSFMYHQVETVASGNRKTLVGWANGRNWQ